MRIFSHEDRLWDDFQKKYSSCDFGDHFFKSKHVGRHVCLYFKGFARIFGDFVKVSKVFTDFAQIPVDFVANILTHLVTFGPKSGFKIKCYARAGLQNEARLQLWSGRFMSQQLTSNSKQKSCAAPLFTYPPKPLKNEFREVRTAFCIVGPGLLELPGE